MFGVSSLMSSVGDQTDNFIGMKTKHLVFILILMLILRLILRRLLPIGFS